MKTMLALFISLAGLVIAILLFLFTGPQGGLQSTDTERILASGTPATARILSLRDTGGRFNSNPSIEFQLEVQPASGPAYVSSTRAIISTVYLAQFQPGASITVKIDPIDPRKIVIVTP